MVAGALSGPLGTSGFSHRSSIFRTPQVDKGFQAYLQIIRDEKRRKGRRRMP